MSRKQRIEQLEDELTPTKYHLVDSIPGKTKAEVLADYKSDNKIGKNDVIIYFVY